tara:strand:- start:1960 stop:2649 length:690 start_codon:yes stop_codon:yes gene_type:complete
MPIAHVQTASLGTTSASTSVETSVGNTTTGNFLVVAAIWFGAGVTFTSVTDDGNQTYTLFGSQQTTSANSQKIRLYYTTNIIGRTAHKVKLTVSAGSAFPSIIISEFSGIHKTSPADVTAGAIGTGTALASGATASRANAEELMIGIDTVEFNTNSSHTAGTNVAWTIPANGAINDGTQFTCGALEYFIASAVGTQQAEMTIGSSVAWAEIIGTFKAASTAGNIAWIKG